MNREEYKNEIDKIKANRDLKNRTLEKIQQKKKVKAGYIKYIVACAMFILIFSCSLIYYNNVNQPDIKYVTQNTKISKVENNLPRFKDIEELKSVLEKVQKEEIITKDIMTTDTMTTDTISTTFNSGTTKQEAKTESFSKTNVQVSNVDEADVVKTDGQYIYYISDKKIYIIQANNLEILSKIEIEEENENFYPEELYIKENRLIILGNSNEYIEEKKRRNNEEIIGDSYSIYSNNMAKALIYDVSNKKNIKQIRTVGLDGNYIQSRMIEDNIYFISRKSLRYNIKMEDDDILPMVKDTNINQEKRIIPCTDIAYFEGTESYNYMIVAGFNIYNNNEVNTETFFGASDIIYASEENLYITQPIYKNGFFSDKLENIIYKFNMKDSQIHLKCKGKVEGDLNNQFSMDEYDENLRIATTSSKNGSTTNQLYILDEDLKEIGKISNLAKGEKIYSVRFMGKVGYIVTFKQIDPLFVIDLSNPKNPVVKGELKIPGYSSYLHPYNETHIIGIGYNTKSNGYGGITKANMKMSMFDVSDLENPKEMFNINIGGDYAYSEVINNHKALFYNKDRDLIGFPVTYREYNRSIDKNGFDIFEIDLDKGFKKVGDIKQDINYMTNINRAIYIGNRLYTLSQSQIVLYDLNTLEKIKQIEL